MLDYTIIHDRIKIKNAAELLKNDVVVYVNTFNTESVEKFAKDLANAHASDQELIPVVIDSSGGSVYSLLAMVDLLRSSDRKIATIVMGKAMSCGAALLTCGDEGHRYAAPISTIMIHDVSAHAFGKLEELKSDAKEAERLNKLIFDLMENNCGHKKGYFLDKLRKEHNSADWFLTPTEAKKLNLVNHIKMPKLVTTVEVNTKLV